MVCLWLPNAFVIDLCTITGAIKSITRVKRSAGDPTEFMLHLSYVLLYVRHAYAYIGNVFIGVQLLA